MKFYYNGKLIRTSKTHIYSHAVINMETGKVEGCRSSKEGAEAIITEYVRSVEKNIESYKALIKARTAGKAKCYIKDGRSGYYAQVREDADYELWITQAYERINHLKEVLKVVELEAVAG